MTAPTSRIAERDSDTARVLPGSVGNLEEADQTVRITLSAIELIELPCPTHPFIKLQLIGPFSAQSRVRQHAQGFDIEAMHDLVAPGYVCHAR